MAPARGPAFAAAMRMVHGVHHHAAHMRAPAEPAVAPRLGERLVAVVRVRDRADGRHALMRHHAGFAGLETQPRHAGIPPDKLHIGPGGARDLSALARLQLDIVDDGADRNPAQRHGVAGLHIHFPARDHRVARLEALRRQDVGQLAVLIPDERDEGRAVGVVFQPLDHRRLFPFAPPEVDPAVFALVAAAAPEDGRAPLVVAPARAGEPLGQRLDRLALVQPAAVHQHQPAAARRSRLVMLERHRLRSPWSHRPSDPLRASPPPSSSPDACPLSPGTAWSFP